MQQPGNHMLTLWNIFTREERTSSHTLISYVVLRYLYLLIKKNQTKPTGRGCSTACLMFCFKGMKKVTFIAILLSSQVWESFSVT